MLHQKSKHLPVKRRVASVYPYRLPAKVTRYLCCTVIGFIVIMILSLIRASQVENWKVANGHVQTRPPPPPAWEKFPFLERYYGGVKNLVSVEDNKPEWPHVKDEPVLLDEIEQQEAQLEQDKSEAKANRDPTEKTEAEGKDAKEKSKREVKDDKKEHSDKDTEKDTKSTDEEKNAEQSKPSRPTIPDSFDWNNYTGRTEEMDLQECFLDAASTIRVPGLRYYDGRPQGFPEHAVGSYEVLSLPEDICFDRFGRYGPYGYGYSSRNGGLSVGLHDDQTGASSVWEETPKVDFRTVNWADVQRRCFKKNQARFKELPSKTPTPHGFFIDDSDVAKSSIEPRAEGIEVEAESKTAESDRTSIKSDAEKSTSVQVESKTSTPAASKHDESTTVKTEAEKPSFTSIEASKVTSASMKASSVASKPSNTAAAVLETPKNRKSRTAVVVRCWDEYNWREDDIANMRSLITELAVTSGGRYDIHLLVQIKNEAAHPVWADEATYRERIEEAIPEEFRGLVTLWSETQMLALYQGVHDLFARGPDLPVHGVYRGLSMAMQYFAYLHAEYDYFWQWEMDVRYTGHYYDLFTKLEGWAKAQPRKGLWERNSRFYLPSVHGTWEDFSQMTRVQSQMGVVGADDIWKGVPGFGGKSPNTDTKGDRTVWGPLRPKDDDDWFEPGNDPVAPTSYERDRYKWGVGEEADYLALSPLFDPEGTTWGLKDDITGFNRTGGLPPRRANIITSSRMSRKLLMTMHKMTAFKKQFAFPEMWPATVALQHGFKAVSVPHPVFVDRAWPASYMAQTYNNGHDGSSGGSRTSIFGDREHNMHGLSWFYNSGFAPNLYRRWLGLRVNNDGGSEFETTTDQSRKGKGVGNMRGGEGRMCLPPMLLHPLKDVELFVEDPEEQAEAEASKSDPGA